MKIITWNINGYRSIVGQNPSKRYDVISNNNKLFEYIDMEEPDIICLQEIKASPEQIEPELLTPKGYYSYYSPCIIKKGYSGVAVFSKLKPKTANNSIGIRKFDDEGRILEIDFGEFILFNIYFPKGYADNDRLDYKLEFYDSLFTYLDKPLKEQKNIIICGDYNTAHHEIDLARPKENIGTSGFMPVERVKLDQLVDMGFVDSFRVINKEPGHYTWWSQRGGARENNVGWRIDYHFVTDKLAGRIKSAKQQPEILGSDHCPVIIDLD